MSTYLDASVILRIALTQPGRLEDLASLGRCIVSALAEVECLRTLDRLRLARHLPDSELASRRALVFRLLASMEVVELEPAILRRAAQPLPTSLATLDAIHLATATLWQEENGTPIVMATHDAALATAARANGMKVIGA
jgi:predicted nucleic acid-binding protein